MKSKIAKPSKAEALDYDDFFREISQAWEQRAKELKARRWAKLKQRELEEAYYARHSPR